MHDLKESRIGGIGLGYVGLPLPGRRINDNMGNYVAAQVVRLMLGKTHVLYDIKDVLPAEQVNGRP